MARPSTDEHRQAVARRLDLLERHLRSTRAAPDSAVEMAEPAAMAQPAAMAVGDEWWRGHTVIAGTERPVLSVVPAVADPAESSVPEAVVPSPPAPHAVAVPGRHASRRAAVPRCWPVRLRFEPGQIAVVAVVVALALAVVCWQLVRARPSGGDVAAAPIASTAPLTAPSAAADPDDLLDVSPTPSPSGPVEAPGRVVVDVAGRVRHPGIVTLPAGARVVDALRRAGGVRRGVDTSSLNLARPLVDGEQVVVGVPGASSAAGGPTAPLPDAPAILVDLNTADPATLETLPQVGPVTAAAIISYRDAHGGFTAIDQLLDVEGIGPATLARLTPLVTI